MANANGIETRVSTSQSCINRSTPFGCKTRLKRLICISFNWSTRDREREINNGRKDGWRATSHVRALKSPALWRFLFLFLHVGIRTIPFKGIPSDDISRSARFNDCFLSTRKRIFAWRERRRDSILTLRFSWEEIIYRDRESENSNVSSNFLSNFLEKIQIYNNNSKHFRYSFRFHSFHRVSICYSIKRPISSLSSLLEIEQLFSMYLEQVNSEVSCRVSRDIVIRGQRRRQGWGEFSRGVACYLGARSGRN